MTNTDIKVKWFTEEDGKKYLISEEVSTRIEINEDNKELKNTKAFFREIIYQSFLNDWNKQIVLEENQDLEIVEVKTIINELIQLCNNKIHEKDASA